MNKMTRLLSLDVFRGITIAIMILVNSPGNRTPYVWLDHSIWNGCTLADLVFPFFIVIVGMSAVLSLTNLKIRGSSDRDLVLKIIKRSAYLFLIGLFLNAFPYHFNASTIRVLGVLQRIAICYFCSSILFLTTKIRTQVLIIGAILISYWLLLTYFAMVYPLTLDQNLVGYLDKIFLSPQHLYTANFDPEGLLSTLPAIASTLIGNVIGCFLLSSSRTKQYQLKVMVIAGIILSMLGWLWGNIHPINKSLWTSSYVLWTAGLALLMFSLCFALIEVKKYIKWSNPFQIFGKHALWVYVLHIFFLKVQAIILIHKSYDELINLRLYITDALFGQLTPQNASLCYALSYLFFWFLIIKGIDSYKVFRTPQRSYGVQ